MLQDTKLVVDDQEVNRTILSEMFRDKYRISVAENGLDALNIVEKERRRRRLPTNMAFRISLPVIFSVQILRTIQNWERKQKSIWTRDFWFRMNLPVIL